VDNGFQKFLGCLKASDLTDLEEHFLVQLAATLVVHMASMEEPAEQLPAPLYVYHAVGQFSTPIWSYEALFCPSSTERMLRKRVEQQTVAIACVQMLVRRRHEGRAARILTKDAHDVILNEKDKHLLFRVAR
jgi:hypothetical protein